MSKLLIKVCGITRVKDAKAAVSLGADLLGFIFYKKSPRYITPAKVLKIVSSIPVTTRRVGVFVNENNEGFHIFDNEDPENPAALAFIKAPGATDLAIKNNVYYINQAVDLIAVTYDKLDASLVVTKRIRNVFPVKISPDGYIPDVEDGAIIIDYELQN